MSEWLSRLRSLCRWRWGLRSFCPGGAVIGRQLVQAAPPSELPAPRLQSVVCGCFQVTWVGVEARGAQRSRQNSSSSQEMMSHLEGREKTVNITSEGRASFRRIRGFSRWKRPVGPDRPNATEHLISMCDASEMTLGMQIRVRRYNPPLFSLELGHSPLNLVPINLSYPKQVVPTQS